MDYLEYHSCLGDVFLYTQDMVFGSSGCALSFFSFCQEQFSGEACTELLPQATTPRRQKGCTTSTSTMWTVISSSMYICQGESRMRETRACTPSASNLTMYMRLNLDPAIDQQQEGVTVQFPKQYRL